MTAPVEAASTAGPPAPPARGWDRALDAGRWLVVALVAVRVLALVVLLATGPDAEGSTVGGDARRYDQIATAAGVPYADVAIEYPPGSYLVVEAVHGDTLYATQVRLGLSQLACDLAAAAVLWWSFGRRVGVAYLLLGLPFIAFPFLYLRLDLVSVALAAAGLAVLHRRRDTTGDLVGGALLALGAVAKLWPAALIPLLVVERRWRALAACLAVGAAAGLAWVGVGRVDGVVQVLSFRGADGWQVESLTGIVVHVADPARIHVDGGAWRTGSMPPGARSALTVLSLATIGLAWWWAGRRRAAGDDRIGLRYGVAPAAATLALLVWAPIISPQYVLWLLPAAAVAVARGDRVLGWLTVAAGVGSTYSLATIVAQIDGAWWSTLAIVVRNAVLVAALAHALLVLAGHGGLGGLWRRLAPRSAPMSERR